MEQRNCYKKGLWTVEEDKILTDYIGVHGKGRWNRIAKVTGLNRSGKSCRLRWMNYLSPSVKKGGFSEEEDDLIIRLHNLLGNRWSLIAGRVPGRTDNQVKNHWNNYLSKKLGLKKKNIRIQNCSETVMSREDRDEVEALGHPLDQSLKTRSCDGRGKGDKITLQSNETSQETVGGSGTSLEPESSDCLVGPFWPCNSDVNQKFPTFFELLGGYPLGMGWPEV